MVQTQSVTKTKVAVLVYAVITAAIVGSAVAVAIGFFAAGLPAGVPVTFTCSETVETSNFDSVVVASKNPAYFNPYVKSSAKQKPYGAYYNDTCLIDMLSTTTRTTIVNGVTATQVIIVAKSTPVASCSAADENNITARNCRLQEGFCTGSKVSNYIYKCANGCSNGACNPTALLHVKKNSTPTDSTAMTGATHLLVGSWTFEVPPFSSSDVTVTAIAIRAATEGHTDNLRLYNDATLIAGPNDGPGSGANSTSTFVLTSPLTISKNSPKTVYLFADIPANADIGEVYSFGITSAAAITALDGGGQPAVKWVEASDGAKFTIAQKSGTLSIAENSATPTRLVSGGSREVRLLDLRLKALEEPIDVTGLVLTAGISSITGTQMKDYTAVSKINFKLDGETLGNVDGYILTAPSTEIRFGTGDLRIPADSVGKRLEIYADIGRVRPDGNIDSNSGIIVDLAYGGSQGFTALGVNSHGPATVEIPDPAKLQSSFIIHKAYPRIAADLLTQNEIESGIAGGILYRINITAVDGDVAIKTLTFSTLTSPDVPLSGGILWLASCSGACNITPYAALTVPMPEGEPSDLPSPGSHRWDLEIASNASHGQNYLMIPEGATAVVEFRASVPLGSPADGIVTTTPLNDLASDLTTNRYGATASDWQGVFGNNNQIWSDLSITNNPGDAPYAQQWYNGYSVPSLPLPSQTVQFGY